MWIFGQIIQIAEHIWFKNDMNDYSSHIVIVPTCAPFLCVNKILSSAGKYGRLLVDLPSLPVEL